MWLQAFLFFQRGIYIFNRSGVNFVVDLLFSLLLRKGTQWFERDRPADHWAQQRDEFKERIELFHFSFNTCYHSVGPEQSMWWNFELFGTRFFSNFPLFLTLIFTHIKKSKQAAHGLLYFALFVTHKPKSLFFFSNSGFWDFVLQLDMKEWMPQLLFE